MVYKIYSIKDVLSGSFNELLLFKNDDLAKRYFAQLCADSKISKDLQMFSLGSYNVDTGDIVSSISYLYSGCDFGGENK